MTWPPCTTCGQPPTRATRRGMCHRCYMNWWTRRRGYGTFESVFVDAEPARQHVIELRGAGLGLRRIAALSGVSREALRCLTIGRPERMSGPSKRIYATTAEALLAVPHPDAPHNGPAAGALVPALGTVRRLQALVAFGYPRSTLAARLGITPANATHLFNLETGHVLVATARKAEAIFGELQLTPGPSDRARNEGRRRGWAVPLEWDEDSIDAADSRPVAIECERLNFADRYGELVELGYIDDDAVARKLGITPEGVDRQLRRYGLRTAS